MAVISCNFTRETYQGSATDRRYTREYVIQTNSVSDGANTVRQYSGLPFPGDAHPADTRAVCVGVNLTQDRDSYKKWDASVQYAIPERDTIPSAGLAPLDENPVIEFSGIPVERVAEKGYQTGDTLGTPTVPIVNSAGDPFDPPIMTEYTELEIRIRQNLTALSTTSAATIAGDILKYQNTVNNATVTLVGATCATGTLWMRRINPVPRYDAINDLDYYEVTWEIVYRPEGWDQKILDAGFRAKFAADGTPDASGKIRPVKISDINSNEGSNSKQAQDPVLLDGTGVILTDSGGDYDPDGTPYYHSFWTKFQQDWSDLNLPSTLP